MSFIDALPRLHDTNDHHASDIHDVRTIPGRGSHDALLRLREPSDHHASDIRDVRTIPGHDSHQALATSRRKRLSMLILQLTLLFS